MELKRYQHTMQILEDNYNRKLGKEALRTWYETLNKERFTNEDIEDGGIVIIKNSRFFPTLAEMIEACVVARKDRLEAQEAKIKAEEQRFRNRGMKDIVENGRVNSPAAMAYRENAKALLDRKIDKVSWQAAQNFISDSIRR